MFPLLVRPESIRLEYKDHVANINRFHTVHARVGLYQHQ